MTGAVDFSCSEGGTAKLSGFQAVIDTTGGANVSQKFTITYTNCGLAKSDAGTAVYNGTWNVTQIIVTSGGNVAIDQKFVGKITVGGAFNDFIDANVTQSVNVSDLGTIWLGQHQAGRLHHHLGRQQHLQREPQRHRRPVTVDASTK